MTDIVKRLDKLLDDINMYDHYRPVIRKAAKEIERLRDLRAEDLELNERLRAAITPVGGRHIGSQAMTDIVERLRMAIRDERELIIFDVREAADEIERLRAALESLTKDPPATLDEPDTDAEVIMKMRAIASAALDIHKGGKP